MMDIEKEHPGRVCGFTVDEKYIVDGVICNKTVVPFETVEAVFPPSEHCMLICVGYNHMNDSYVHMYKRAKEKNYDICNYINASADFNGKINGDGNIILGHTYVGYDTTFGSGNRILQNTVMTHDIIMGDYNYCAAGVAFAGFINIGNNCFFGMNSTIKNRIDIADYTLVGAGAYISKSTEKNSVYVPERSIRLDHTSKELI